MKSPPTPHPYSTDVSQSLRASESRYRKLCETAQDGILLLDADTAPIEDVNPCLIAMPGYSHAECLGKMLWEAGSFTDSVESKEIFAERQTKGHVQYKVQPVAIFGDDIEHLKAIYASMDDASPFGRGQTGTDMRASCHQNQSSGGNVLQPLGEGPRVAGIDPVKGRAFDMVSVVLLSTRRAGLSEAQRA